MLLKIINGKRQGEVVSLGSSDPITIGRGGDNHLDLPDSKISRQHAQVFSNQGKWFLKNVQPTKPVYVNEIPHSSTLHLQPGMRVKIGDTLLEFEPNPGAPPSHTAPGTAAFAAQAGGGSGRSRILPLLLGIGGGIFIVGLVLLFVTRGPFALTPQEVEATNVAIVLASASPTPTASHTPEPTATATATATPTATPTVTVTATPQPTPTRQPLLEPKLGQVTTRVYTNDDLDPNLLQEVTWERDILMTVPLDLTNNTKEPINVNDIGVGWFATPVDELKQVPSFILDNQDKVIEPGETQTVEWQLVLPKDVELEAWAVEFNGESMQEFIEE